jgi:hypothetical protein
VDKLTNPVGVQVNSQGRHAPGKRGPHESPAPTGRRSRERAPSHQGRQAPLAIDLDPSGVKIPKPFSANILWLIQRYCPKTSLLMADPKSRLGSTRGFPRLSRSIAHSKPADRTVRAEISRAIATSRSFTDIIKGMAWCRKRLKIYFFSVFGWRTG